MNIGYAWRAQIGLITPSSVPNMEHDFHRFAPPGVGISTTRVVLNACNRETLMAMAEQLETAASIYDGRPVNVVTFGCTSGSFIGGMGFDRILTERIAKSAGCKGLTTSTSLMDAIKVMNIQRLAVVTPYIDEVNEAEYHFLQDQGITVTSIAGLGLGLPKQIPGIAELPPSDMYQFVRKQDLSTADAVFVSCTGLNVLDIIPYVENDLGLPCLTSNQVSLWGALRACGVMDKIPALGTLCTQH